MMVSLGDFIRYGDTLYTSHFVQAYLSGLSILENWKGDHNADSVDNGVRRQIGMSFDTYFRRFLRRVVSIPFT